LKSGRVRVFQGGRFWVLEPDDGKPSSPVLRRLGASNGARPLNSNVAVRFTGITEDLKLPSSELTFPKTFPGFRQTASEAKKKANYFLRLGQHR
jgi:hypothetical protein